MSNLGEAKLDLRGSFIAGTQRDAASLLFRRPVIGAIVCGGEKLVLVIEVLLAVRFLLLKGLDCVTS